MSSKTRFERRYLMKGLWLRWGLLNAVSGSRSQAATRTLLAARFESGRAVADLQVVMSLSTMRRKFANISVSFDFGAPDSTFTTGDLGSDSLQRWLREQLPEEAYAVSRHASDKGFRVIEVRAAS